jgi:hypothetical protein
LILGNVVFADTFSTRRALGGLSQSTATTVAETEATHGFLIRPAHHYKSQPMFMRYSTLSDVKPDKPNFSQRLWLPENKHKKINPDPEVVSRNEKVLSNKVKTVDKSALLNFLNKKDPHKRRKRDQRDQAETPEVKDEKAEENTAAEQSV